MLCAPDEIFATTEMSLPSCGDRPPIMTQSTLITRSCPMRHQTSAKFIASAENFIREFRVDYGIIGISGIDQEGNMLDFDYREVSVARTIIECSRRVFLATDNSKFGRSAMVRVANVCDIEAVFSNAPLEEHWQHMLQEAGTELYLV